MNEPKTRDMFFRGRGMCIINFIKTKENEKSVTDEFYQFQIILFGQCRCKNITTDFLHLNMILSYKGDKSDQL